MHSGQHLCDGTVSAWRVSSGLKCRLEVAGSGTSLGLLGAIFRPRSLSSGDTGEILCTSNQMIADTRAILYTSSPDQDDGMLLEIVTFTGNVGGYGAAIGELDTGDFTDSRVGFLWLGGEDLAANALDKGFGLEGGHFIDRWAVRFACATEVLLQSDGQGLGGGKSADGRSGSLQTRGPSHGTTEERRDNTPRHDERRAEVMIESRRKRCEREQGVVVEMGAARD